MGSRLELRSEFLNHLPVNHWTGRMVLHLDTRVLQFAQAKLVNIVNSSNRLIFLIYLWLMEIINCIYHFLFMTAKKNDWVPPQTRTWVYHNFLDRRWMVILFRAFPVKLVKFGHVYPIARASDCLGLERKIGYQGQDAIFGSHVFCSSCLIQCGAPKIAKLVYKYSH